MKTRAPVWLNVRDVVALHERLLSAHGGASGLRDPGLLESALTRAKHGFAYGRHDLFALASACASGIIRNHLFVDGNKRVGFMAAFVFLGVNGVDLRADEAEAVRAVLALADRAMDDDAFAAWLRANCVPRRERLRPAHAPRERRTPPRKTRAKRGRPRRS